VDSVIFYVFHPAAITFCQTCGYLSSHRASLPLCRYQVILLWWQRHIGAHSSSSIALALAASEATFVFKLAIIVFKSLRGETPPYLADDCQLIADSRRRCIRSADANAVTIPQTNTRLGDRRFSLTGSKVWNSLPATLQQPDVELGQFKRLLKTFLFDEAAAH